jgi:hypothetical protein
MVDRAAARVNAAGGPGMKEGRQILSEFANTLAGITALFQPSRDPSTGELVWRKPEHKSLFLEFLREARLCARDAAPYESPTFKAVHFMNQWHEGAARTTIEAAAALVTDDMDEEMAAEQYLIQVRGAA